MKREMTEEMTVKRRERKRVLSRETRIYCDPITFRRLQRPVRDARALHLIFQRRAPEIVTSRHSRSRSQRVFFFFIHVSIFQSYLRVKKSWIYIQIKLYTFAGLHGIHTLYSSIVALFIVHHRRDKV